MAIKERTMQQMNPIGQGGMWDVALVMGLSAWAYITMMCVIQFPSAIYPDLLLVTWLTFTAAIVVHLWAANPQHAPYRAAPYHWVAGLASVGAICQMFALHTDDPRMAVVWGPMAVAYLLASASVFRPSVDQIVTGAVVIAVLASAVVIDGQAAVHPFGIAYVAIAVVGILAIIILGQASYTGKATRTLDAWSIETARTLEEYSTQVREEVSADFTARLSREFQAEAEPLLSRVVQSGRISVADITEAQSLAGRVRNRLIELNAQNWLQAAGSVVEDEEGLVNEIDDSVRAALVALCVGLEAAGLGQPHFTLSGGGAPGSMHIDVRAQVHHNLVRSRVELAPYIRVLYVAFDNVRVSFRGSEVSLKFKYGERK